MKTQLAIALSMLFITVGRDDSPHNGEPAEKTANQPIEQADKHPNEQPTEKIARPTNDLSAALSGNRVQFNIAIPKRFAGDPYWAEFHANGIAHQGTVKRGQFPGNPKWSAAGNKVTVGVVGKDVDHIVFSDPTLAVGSLVTFLTSAGQSESEGIKGTIAQLKPIPPPPRTIGMKFMKIPAGTFLMGSPDTEKDRHDNEHQHKVTISKPFYMQTTEVTQGQWKAVMDSEPWKEDDNVKIGPNYAAPWISWNDSVAYCKKLSAKEGKTYRLPTEAEWEYACRAGTETRWSFGDDEKVLGDYAWYYNNASNIGEKYAHRVALKKPNAFGLYDMHGNVWEWCHDYYGKNYYTQSTEKDPRGPAEGSSRILRGGGWLNSSRYSRSALRGRPLADYRNYFLGFRVVRELD